MSILEKFRTIRAFILDVDGVLTDGTVQVFETGEQVRNMSIRDGYALQLAVKKGYKVAVISGASSEGVRKRLQLLGITDIFMKVEDKLGKLEEYAKENGLQTDEILFMGDDIPDYSVMRYVGLPCAPADAAPEIRHVAAYISSFGGGQGCVRDVIEKVLKLNGHWALDTSVASK